MYSSVVNIAVALVLSGPAQVQKLSKVESDVWRSVRSSVLVLQANGSDRGVAICVDASGYFVAHKNLVGFPILFGRMGNGQMIQLYVHSTDPTTELSLLKADVGRLSGLRPVAVAEEPEGNSLSTAFAIVPGGSIKTEISSVDKLGIMQPSRRAVPLLELRFEAPLTRVGGAPLFTQKGELLGFISAALATDEDSRIQNQQTLAKSTVGGTGGFGRGGVVQVAPTQFGPTGLTVAYAIGPSAMVRVIDGYRSPERQVVFPAIGIVIADAKPTGAEIRQISEKSPASEAGLQLGDIIIEIGSQRIRNQIDYAKYMMRRKVGESLEVKVLRGTETIALNVVPRS